MAGVGGGELGFDSSVFSMLLCLRSEESSWQVQREISL